MARYLSYKLTGGNAPLSLALRSGVRFILRPGTSENSDYGVAYEVFVTEDYRPPSDIDRTAVKLVVDIGGNVGFSALYWTRIFPNCDVEVFEPHPLHLVQMRKNLALAGMANRVTVHGQAAGASARPVRISRHGTSSSTLVEDERGFETEMVDLIDLMKGRRIDVLKLDAEGGEYELLADARFGELQIGHLVLEWHQRDNDAEADRRWCEQRLVEMGYTLQPLAARPTPTMLWASRTPT